MHTGILCLHLHLAFDGSYALAGQEKGEVKRYSFNSTFPSLPSVAKARKRRE